MTTTTPIYPDGEHRIYSPVDRGIFIYSENRLIPFVLSPSIHSGQACRRDVHGSTGSPRTVSTPHFHDSLVPLIAIPAEAGIQERTGQRGITGAGIANTSFLNTGSAKRSHSPPPRLLRRSAPRKDIMNLCFHPPWCRFAIGMGDS